VSLDNPAGRLHALLERLSERDPNAPLISAWAHTLDVDQAEVPFRLGAVGQLLPAVREAAESTGDRAWITTVQQYHEEWTAPIFPRRRGLNTVISESRPSPSALVALGTLSSHLHAVRPEGMVPTDDELDNLKERLGTLTADVGQATDLPEEIKHLIVARLNDVLRAIQHVDIGGPEAVRMATETLLGAIFVREPASARSSTFRRVAATLGIVWVAFSSGPTIQKSLDAWDGLVKGFLAAGDGPTETTIDKESPGTGVPDQGERPAKEHAR
jgi:hypothetical protein